MSNNRLINTILSSFVPGLGNLPGATASLAFPNTVLAANAGATYTSQTLLTTGSAIPEVHVQIPDLGTQWYLVDGIFSIIDPGNNWSITVSVKFDASIVYFTVSVVDFSGVGTTIPPMTITFDVNLYTAPW